MTCKDDYPRFEATDEVRKVVDVDFTELPPAEWYVSTTFKIMQGKVELCPDWYPTVFIRIALERGYLDKDDITHILPASNKYDHQLFIDHANAVHEMYPNKTSKYAKNIINHHIGFWGRRVETRHLGACTDSWPIACAMMNQYKDVTIHEVGDMKFMRTSTETPMTDGYLPIWRQIIALSIMELDTMANDLLGDKSVLLGMTTDSIKVMNPKAFKTGTNPGEYQIEKQSTQAAMLSCHGTNMYSNTEGWFPEEREWEDITKEELLKRGTGCLVCGPPGANKSTILRQLARSVKKDERLIAGWTCKTVESLNIRDKYDTKYLVEGPIGAITLDRAYPNQQPIAASIQHHSRKTNIFIDEFSMLQTKWMSILLKQKVAAKSQKFYIFGDSNQTPPMQDYDTPTNLINYEDSAIMYYLCGGTRCRLPYMVESGRYDLVTKSRLDELLTSGIIDTSDKKLFEVPEMTLCKTPQRRAKVNRIAFEVFSKDKRTEEIGDLEWFQGMPIIAYSGNAKFGIVNSHKCTIRSIQDSFVTVETPIGVTEVPIDQFPKLFRYGWAETIRRFQGDKITSPYNIVEAKMMSTNDLYTAIGRTTKWDNVGLDNLECEGREFKKVSYEFKCRESKPEQLELFDGKIYEITPPSKEWTYIGMTVQDPKTRELQHHHKPSNPEMQRAMQEPDVKMQVVASYRCTKQELAKIETEYLHRAVHRGVNLYNKQKTKIVEAAKPPVIEHKTVQTKFNITDDPNKKRLRMQYHDADGKRVSKEFGYARCGIDVAMVKAEEYRNKLME